MSSAVFDAVADTDADVDAVGLGSPGLVGRVLDDVVAYGLRSGRITHVEAIAARPGQPAAWPGWLAPEVVEAYHRRGITSPWVHQVRAADLAHAGRHVVVATGTASGKSLAYQLPVVQQLVSCPPGRGAGLERDTALYLSPTKALAADQLRALAELRLPALRPATYDGDTPSEQRRWIREHANLVLANPDLVHRSLLPGHRSWASFLRGLRFVIVDECHGYRGVFGSHVAQILRRLRRVCAHYGSAPVFVFASATVAQPAVSASRLAGLDVVEVTADFSPRAGSRFVLWEPPAIDDGPQPARRSASAETADLLARLAAGGVCTVAFVRSRRAAESVAMTARHTLDGAAPALANSIAAYRAGYLPEERRELERALRDGRLRGLAATTALELGIDVSGLDAVLITGFPGTRASMWQQAGRAGRDQRESLAVLIARDDPLDTYLVRHPEAVFGRAVEASVFDPDNPYVLAPHLCAAAAECPLTPDDLATFGRNAPGVVDDLVARGLLRRRPTGWYWTRRERPADLADIRGAGGSPVCIVEIGTGQFLGTANPVSADATVHEGAVYVHQGHSYVVDSYHPDAAAALVKPAAVDYSTHARARTDVTITRPLRTLRWGEAEVSFGAVDVRSQVVGYLRRRLGGGEVIGDHPLALPVRQLATNAVWWTVSPAQVERAGLDQRRAPGAAHAAEHAAIGLLPLVATCDRWDIGGVSAACHPDTGRLTVVVYDGYPGGAGFAERGFEAAQTWLSATRDAIAACPCESGCPSCVHSPKCGSGNDPLDKPGAIALLGMLLEDSCAAN